MNRKSSQWMLFTGIVFLSSLGGLILFERAGAEVAEALLTPWFAICRAITPMSWQTQGNILLGMMWLVCGVAVYSIFIGTCLATGSGFLARSRLVQPAFNSREKKK